MEGVSTRMRYEAPYLETGSRFVSSRALSTGSAVILFDALFPSHVGILASAYFQELRMPQEFQYLRDLKARHIQLISQQVRVRLKIDDWVKLNTLISVPLEDGFSYLGLDEYHKSAIILAANDIIKERNDSEQKAWNEIKTRQEELNTYKSNFDSLPKPPSFGIN